MERITGRKKGCDGYMLEGGSFVQYNDRTKTYEAQGGEQCKPVWIGGILAGFSFPVPVSDEDERIYSITETGKAYLKYNQAVGGDPFGFTTGMPGSADPQIYGGIPQMYGECIRRGITWEELLQWDGHSDELPTEMPQNSLERL